MKYWPTKTPGSVWDRGLNWQPTLDRLGGGLMITASVWDKLHGDADVTVGTFDNTTATTRVLGGTANEVTVFRNTVTLSNGLVLTEDVMQKCRA